jgi:hypothetical protein
VFPLLNIKTKLFWHFLHIITMTKQDATCILPPVPGDSSGAGAPDISPASREMREAGALVLMEWNGILDSESLAARVYSAMVLASIR